MTSSGEIEACNLENVYTCLKKGNVAADDFDMGAYIEAYKELYNFFVVLGSAFHFVASDVKTKIGILEDHRKKSENLDNFSTVKKMMEYEINSNLIKDSKYVSGSRTLLRLHRGLDFVRQFLGAVEPLEDQVGVGGVCKQAYDKTLGNFHPFAIRTAASLAMKLLPIKRDLLAKMTKNNKEVADRLVAAFPDMLATMGVAFDRIDALYTKYNLHNLS